MRIDIQGRSIAISDAIDSYINKKVGKLSRLFDDDVEAQVHLRIDHHRQICEITIPLRGVILRAEEVADDMYAAVDGVIAKLERQIRKHRTKLSKRFRHGIEHSGEELYESPFEETAPGSVIRTKHFALEPMNAEGAIEQMELLGHSFFMFLDESSRQVQTVYKRADGNYGLLIPD
ncbi:MAG: ribosome-associated translation inhibitor RaiA [Christensenellaceae bacterium]|jgi:putative sigma-54 modulation protein|nr:ribosome-associated translation inhibitor RaiA [Christensenellaceae bacterium]